MIYSIICEGDSLSSGMNRFFWRNSGIDAGRFTDEGLGIRTGMRHVNGNRIYANLSLFGSRINQLEARAATVDALVNQSTAGQRTFCLMLMVGTNVEDSSPAVHAARVGAYCQARRAAGFAEIFLGTLVSSTGNAVANFDTAYAQPFNALIKGAGWAAANGVTAIVDFAADANLGATGAAANTDYFNVDGVHPATAGEILMAEIFEAALVSRIGSVP